MGSKDSILFALLFFILHLQIKSCINGKRDVLTCLHERWKDEVGRKGICFSLIFLNGHFTLAVEENKRGREKEGKMEGDT